MAQIALAESPAVARSVLGSCIGVALYDPRTMTGAFAHVVLPESQGRTGPAGKFADTAILSMLASLASRGVRRGGVIAKLAGGASMFGAGGPIQIGRANADAVLRLLAEAQIPVAGTHLGGSQGRRMSFDFSTGKATVEVAGAPPAIL